MRSEADQTKGEALDPQSTYTQAYTKGCREGGSSVNDPPPVDPRAPKGGQGKGQLAPPRGPSLQESTEPALASTGATVAGDVLHDKIQIVKVLQGSVIKNDIE